MDFRKQRICVATLTVSLPILVALSISVWYRAQPIMSLDEWFLQLAHAMESSFLTAFFSMITYLGSGYVIFPFIFLILYVKRHIWWNYALKLLFSTLASTILVNLLKQMFDKNRPPLALQDISSYGYPSGHTSLAFAFYFGFFLILFKKEHISGPIALSLATSLSLLVAFSRLYLRVHYLSDVIGGALIGISFFILFFCKDLH